MRLNRLLAGAVTSLSLVSNADVGAVKVPMPNRVQEFRSKHRSLFNGGRFLVSQHYPKIKDFKVDFKWQDANSGTGTCIISRLFGKKIDIKFERTKFGGGGCFYDSTPYIDYNSKNEEKVGNVLRSHMFFYTIAHENNIKLEIIKFLGEFMIELEKVFSESSLFKRCQERFGKGYFYSDIKKINEQDFDNSIDYLLKDALGRADDEDNSKITVS